MNELIENLSAEAKEKIAKKKQPEWISPMLAKLSHEIFSDKNWIYERKLDGERCLINKKGKTIKIFTRNKKEISKTYPEVVKAINKQKTKNFIIDGEMVAFDGNVTIFSKLQNRMHLKDKKEIKENSTKVYYYLFDIIFYDKYDLTNMQLIDRKKVLKNLFDYRDPLRLTPYKKENGKKYHTEACKKGWEGIIAKKMNSEYSKGRSSNWLKLKCTHQQEFVIGGYTDPQGERISFGALLIGYYKKGNLKYAGKVGTGYDDETLKLLYEKLSKIEIDKPAFNTNEKNLPSKKVHWVKPDLIAEIGFTEWTNDNKLRHPRYLGLRRDKKSKDVKKES